MRVSAAIAFCAAVAAAASASAHSQGFGTSLVEFPEDGIRVQWNISPNELVWHMQAKFDDDGSTNLEEAEIAKHQEHLFRLFEPLYVVQRGPQTCEPQVEEKKPIAGTDILYLRTLYRCDGDDPVHISLPVFEVFRRTHAHHLTLVRDGKSQSVTLTAEIPSWSEDIPETVAGNVWRFFILGLEHILIGYDHLLFLFALLVVSMKLGELVRIVTAFTIAHSITLIAAAFDAAYLAPWIVEPGIALTIAYVGYENFVIKDAARRWRITFGLGLVHGFGFAGLLEDIGLPKEGRTLSLLSFNVGVEVGQLAVVLLVVPALNALRKPRTGRLARALILVVGLAAAYALHAFEPTAAIGLGVITTATVILVPMLGYHRVVRVGGSLAVIALGLLWFVERIW